MSTHASPAAFTISDITAEDPTAFPLSISLIDSDYVFAIKRGMLLIVSAWENYFYPMKTLVFKKLFIIIFPSYFLIFITDCQYTIIISYTLLRNDIVISFDNPLHSLLNTLLF